MIMQNKRLVMEDMSKLEQFMGNMKLQFFSLMNMVVEANFVSLYLYRILILLEALQLAYFSIHDRLKFVWDNSFIQAIQTITKNIQFQGFLDNGSGSMMETILILCFIINFLMVVLLLITGYALQQKRKRESLGALNYSLKLLSFYGVLIKTIQPLPFLDIFLNGLICPSSKFSTISCYSGLYFIYSAMSVIGLLFQVFLWFVFSTMMIDMNPFSHIPFAQSPSLATELRMVIKILLTFYFSVDYTAGLQVTLAIILSILYLIILVFDYQKAQFYDDIAANIQISADAALFWISFCSSVQGIIASGSEGATQNISAVYLFLGIPLSIFLFLSLLQQRNNRILQRSAEEIKKPAEMEEYALLMIKLILDRADRNSCIKLKGILHLHAVKCKESEDICPCQILSKTHRKYEEQQQMTKQSSSSQQQLQQQQQIEPQVLSKVQLDEQQKLWFYFLKVSISTILKKYNKCSKIHILIGYLDHEKLKLKFRALTEMMTAEMFKPTLREKFSMFRYKYLIELDIIDTDMRNEQNKNVDVNGIVHFENQLVIFMKSIEISVNFHLEFWRELLEESPDIEKLQIVGSRITNTIEDAKACFNNLCSIRQNNIRSLLIYGNFLKEVVNEEVESQEHLEKAAYVSKSSVVNKQLADNENMKYSENSNTGILTMSANIDTRFYVQNTNYDFSRILGWPKQEIVDMNIKNHIMPKLISSIHDGLVSQYIDSSIPRAIGIERLITPTNKDGYLVPSILMIKILPNLEEGLQFVGFFKEKDEIYCAPYKRTDNFDDDIVHYIVYKADQNLQNQTIVGITQSVNERFGIPTSLVNNNSPMSNQFTIDLICPLLTNLQVLEDIQTEQGALIEMDTTIIEQLFLISQESEEDEKPEGNLDKSKINTNGNKSNLFNNNEQMKSKLQGGAGSQSQQSITNLSNLNNVNLKTNPVDPAQIILEEEQGSSHQTNDLLPKKYRKAQINVWLEEEFIYRDTVLHIIKFIEADSEDNSGQNPEQPGINGLDGEIDHNEQEALLEAEREQELLQQQNEAEDNINNNNDDARSNASGTSQDYEELRQLKDIKTAISEKTKPKTIKILQYCVILVSLLLFVLVSVDLAYKISENDQMSEAMDSIYYSYDRHSVMADINYLTRKLWFLSNDYIVTSSATVKATLGNTIQTTVKGASFSFIYVIFQSFILFVWFKINPIALAIRSASEFNSVQSTESVNVDREEKRIRFLRASNINQDALNVYIAESGGLSNTTLANFDESLSTATSITSTKSSFYSVNFNGIYSLRTASETIAGVFYSNYYDEIGSFKTTFLIIMILSILVLVTSQFVLLPIIFQVQRTNAIVLSFFAIVPVQEIQHFANRCENFLTIYIERKENADKKEQDDQEEGKEQGFDGMIDNEIDQNHSNVVHQKEQFLGQNNDQNNNNNNSVLHNQSYLNNQSNINYNNQSVEMSMLGAGMNSQIQQQQQQQQQPQQQKKQQLNQIEQQRIKDQEEKRNEDEENQRQKILNAKDHKKKLVVMQFGVLTILVMLYFILNFVALEMSFQSNLKDLFNHTVATRSRPSLLKYYFDFIQEGLVNLIPIQNASSSGILQSEYSKLIQSNDDVITTSFKTSFPSELSSYKSYFSEVNFDSLCTYSTVKVSSLTCSTISALQNGLQRVITQIGVDGNQVLADTLSGSMTTIQLLASLSYLEIENIMLFVSPTIDLLNVQFSNEYNDYLSFKGLIDKLCFSLFITAIVIIFIFVWIPYLQALIRKIWMTKGVLNMIPIDVILKHEKLRQAFTTGDILSAVK